MDNWDINKIREKGFDQIRDLRTLDFEEIQKACANLQIELQPIEFCKHIRSDLNETDILIIYSACDIKQKTYIFPQWVCLDLRDGKKGTHIATGKPIAFKNVAELQQFAYIVTREKLKNKKPTKFFLLPAKDLVRINNKGPWPTFEPNNSEPSSKTV